MGKIITLTISWLVGSAAVGFSNGSCCTNKVVGGIHYSLVGIKDTETYNCRSNCVYEDDSNPGTRVCFAMGGELKVECSGEYFVQYCHEYVQPFLDFLSASNQSIGCCNNGKLTPTFCGGDPFNPCQDPCGDITCVMLVPDPHDSQYCSQSGIHMLSREDPIAISGCQGEPCPNKNNDNCPCCMDNGFRLGPCKKKCKCLCRCRYYKKPALCGITSCAECTKYEIQCAGGKTGTTIPPTSPCLDGTYPGRWTGGISIGYFTSMQACAKKNTDFHSFSWNHKTHECISVNRVDSTSCKRNTFDADQADWCSSCPNSAAPGAWQEPTNAPYFHFTARCYEECSNYAKS